MQTTDTLRDESRGLLEELVQRLGDAREELDEYIGDHPFAAVGIAFAIGAVIALGPPRVPPRGERTLGNLLVAGLGALAVRGIKSYTWSRLSGAARGMFDGKSRERVASHDRSVEPFLEH